MAMEKILFRSVVLLTMMIFCGKTNAVEVDLRHYGDLKFYYDSVGSPIVRQISQPLNQVQYHPGNPYGTESLAFGIPSASQPAGVGTQAMSFDFYSENYFSQNPSGHIAVMIKGTWAFDNPKTLPNESEVSGRGIILGSVAAAPNGCPSARIAQIESFWATGNALIPDTCSAQLSDNVWYRVTIHANNNRWIAYWITDLSGTVFYAYHAIQDPGSYISEDLGGWVITPAFSSVYAPTWAAYFNNVKTWWF